MYIFVIDTDQYAGNFEREMTAYMTGQYGDCGVGAELISEIESAGLSADYFEDLIDTRPDEHGCYRPCKIWQTPGWFNDGLGGHFREGDEEIAKKRHRAECLKKANDPVGVHPNDVERNKKRWLEAADEFKKYPAYNSVAIFMTREPTEEEVRVLKQRAHDWTNYVQTKQACSAESPGTYCFLKYGNIEGFRLIREETTQEQVKKWEL